MTGNLKLISDSRIRKIVSKGPKYRFPSYINFVKCREEIASALYDFGNRWCKREGVEDNALKEWKRSIFTIVDKRIKFYSQNTNLLLLNPNRHFPFLDLHLFVANGFVFFFLKFMISAMTLILI